MTLVVSCGRADSLPTSNAATGLAPEQARQIAVDELRAMRLQASHLRLAVAETPIAVVSIELIEGTSLDRALDRETQTNLLGRVYLVLATGPFLSEQAVVDNPITSGSGWFAIDAANGKILAMGMP